MIVIVWEFHVQPAQKSDFERAYGAEGDWARLFRRSPAYRGTELLRDPDDPKRYLTLDRWDGVADFEAFKAGNGDDYHALDAACEPLCSQERFVGRFTCTSSSSISTAP